MYAFKLRAVTASVHKKCLVTCINFTIRFFIPLPLRTIASLVVETPQLSGAMTSEELTTIHITSLFRIKDIVLDIPLDITMLTDVAAESSKKLAFRIKQLQQAERSYQ